MRILIISNMNSEQPYGAWTRPYYIGEALSDSKQIFQLGYDTSGVEYCSSLSTRSKNIFAYVRAIRTVNEEFRPDVIYAHETFPAMAAYLGTRKASNKSRLIFDIHALHAAEYKAMLSYYDNRARGIYLFTKAYYPQRYIVRRGIPLIAASAQLKTMLKEWYKVDGDLVRVVPNGASKELLNSPSSTNNPYPPNLQIVLLVAPKNNLPNELAVKFLIETADKLLNLPGGENIRLMIVGGGWGKDEVEVHSNLVYLGFVDDLKAYVDFADVCLLPFPKEASCGGARNKALDYFARGKLVLTTDEGLRGLHDFKNNEQVIISSYNSEKYAQDLLKLMNDLEGYKRIGQNARRLVEKEFNWQHSAEKVSSVFEQVTKEVASE